MSTSTPVVSSVVTSLFQPSRLAFWVFWLGVAAGVYATINQVRFGSRVMPVSVLAGAAVWVLYTLPVVWLLRRLGVVRGQTTMALVMAFLWGGFGATYLAVPANQAVFSMLAKLVEPGFQWQAAIAGPSNEEPLKLIGVILMVAIAPARFRTIASVVAIGTMVGLGFQVVEDFYYTVNGSLSHPNADQFEPVIENLITRGMFSGLWSHAAYTTIASFGVGYFVARREEPLKKRVLVAGATFLGAWALHAFWNSPLLTSILADNGILGVAGFFLLKGTPSILAAILLWRVARRDASLVE